MTWQGGHLFLARAYQPYDDTVSSLVQRGHTRYKLVVASGESTEKIVECEERGGGETWKRF
jgi:hypothetical protein